MKTLIKISKILFVCLIVLSHSVLAQPIAEPEVFNSQAYNFQGPSHSANININAEVLMPESGKYDINEETPIHETLPALSDMLNRDVESKSATSFESIRRNSIFSVETTLVSRFLGFATTRKSA